MSLRSNGSYIGYNRVTTTAQDSASGIWSLAAAERRRRAAAWPPSSFDPYFANVSLLLHMDGSNNSTTFNDSSSNAFTVTANGNAKISTAESKFGGASAFFNGSSDALSFNDLAIGTDAFTIEMFFKTASSVRYAQLIGNELDSMSGFTLLINNNSSEGGQIAVYRNGVLVVQSSSGDWSDDSWHHVAVVRSGSSVTLYIDGTAYGTASDSGSYSGGAYYVGRNNVYSSRPLVGYIDELRITKGVARYTANFTPPTAAFPDS